MILRYMSGLYSIQNDHTTRALNDGEHVAPSLRVYPLLGDGNHVLKRSSSLASTVEERVAMIRVFLAVYPCRITNHVLIVVGTRISGGDTCANDDDGGDDYYFILS